MWPPRHDSFMRMLGGCLINGKRPDDATHGTREQYDPDLRHTILITGMNGVTEKQGVADGTSAFCATKDAVKPGRRSSYSYAERQIGAFGVDLDRGKNVPAVGDPIEPELYRRKMQVDDGIRIRTLELCDSRHRGA